MTPEEVFIPPLLRRRFGEQETRSMVILNKQTGSEGGKYGEVFDEQERKYLVKYDNLSLVGGEGEGWFVYMDIVDRQKNNANSLRFHACDDESHKDCWSVYRVENEEWHAVTEHIHFYAAYEIVYGIPYPD